LRHSFAPYFYTEYTESGYGRGTLENTAYIPYRIIRIIIQIPFWPTLPIWLLYDARKRLLPALIILIHRRKRCHTLAQVSHALLLLQVCPRIQEDGCSSRGGKQLPYMDGAVRKQHVQPASCQTVYGGIHVFCLERRDKQIHTAVQDS
jgi:hypothetical protein